jgi:hypothetical protein
MVQDTKKVSRTLGAWQLGKRPALDFFNFANGHSMPLLMLHIVPQTQKLSGRRRLLATLLAGTTFSSRIDPKMPPVPPVEAFLPLEPLNELNRGNCTTRNWERATLDSSPPDGTILPQESQALPLVPVLTPWPPTPTSCQLFHQLTIFTTTRPSHLKLGQKMGQCPPRHVFHPRYGSPHPHSFPGFPHPFEAHQTCPTRSKTASQASIHHHQHGPKSQRTGAKKVSSRHVPVFFSPETVLLIPAPFKRRFAPSAYSN